MNDELRYSRSDILRIYRHLEQIVVSLDRVGSHMAELPHPEADRVLSKFICEWQVFNKLADARQVLGSAFSEAPGADDMEELERECLDVEFWTSRDS